MCTTRQLVFIDESFVHQNRVSNFGLAIEDTPLQKPSGKGKKIIMAGGLNDSGWLGYDYSQTEFETDDRSFSNGSIKCWAAQVGGDYHRNFNKENFEDYFIKKIFWQN